MRGPGCSVMAKTLLHQYWDIPEGTECHHKAYATTSIGGATGERWSGPQGGGRREAVGSLGAFRGRPGGAADLAGWQWSSSGCLGMPWDAQGLSYKVDFVGVSD